MHIYYVTYKKKDFRSVKANLIKKFLKYYTLNTHAAVRVYYKKNYMRHSELTVPEWSPTSVLGKPNDA